MLNYKKYAKSTAHEVNKPIAEANIVYAVKTSTVMADNNKKQIIKQITK